MKKSEKERRESVIEKLKHQEIRDVRDLESYKLSTCHPASAGIDLGSRSNYVAINPDIAAELGIPIVREFTSMTSGDSGPICASASLCCRTETDTFKGCKRLWCR